MKHFVQLQLIGAGQYVVQAQEFDSGRGGIGTTLKLASGDSINVRGTLAEVLEALTRAE